MKSSDMELQAIREKLRLLQAEPPAAEALTLPLPWADVGTSGRYESDRAKKTQQAQANERQQQPADLRQVAAVSKSTDAAKSPQERAIEALKQRSRGYDQAAIAQTDNLVAQEIYRLEVQANNINERSQQQAADIMALKRSAQAAAVGLRRQGIQEHPQLATITAFLERYQSAAVPHIERDAQGHFELTYDTIDFQQAEQDAMDNAHTLRNRLAASSSTSLESIRAKSLETEALEVGSLPSGAFAEPIETAGHTNAQRSSDYTAATPWFNAASKRLTGSVGKFSKLSASSGQRLSFFAALLSGGRKRRQRRRLATTPDGFAASTALFNREYTVEHEEEGFLAEGAETNGIASGGGTNSLYSKSQFSWLDGTIWFSGAAIARIIIQAIATSYPFVQTASLLALVGIIIFAIYRVITSQTHDYSLVYQLCIAILGLFLAGLF